MFLRKTGLCFLVLMLLLVLAATQLSGQVAGQNNDSPKLPETDAGRRVAAYLKAFNSGEEQSIRQFFTDNVSAAALAQRSIDARLGVYREMHGNIGTITLRRITETSESQITVLAQTASGEWREITFFFEPESPHRFMALRVQDGDPPPDTAPKAKEKTEGPAPMSQAEVVSATERYLNELVAADEFSGTVLIARDGKLIFQKAVGLASQEYDVPNRIDTKFNLGSINKIFTQVAIGQLIDAGKLSLDDKLGKLLPDYPNRPAAEKVTIRQLLDMSSGIGDFFGPEFEAMPKNRVRTIKDFLPLFAAEPLLFEPGTKRQYSNGGYVVLGAIIERVSGQDYYQYVREHVFAPAGMQNTDWFDADIPTLNLASGYTREGFGWKGTKVRGNNMYTRPAKGSSAGGGYSTAQDLLKFTLALQSHKLRIPEFRSTDKERDSSSAKSPGPGFVGIAGGAPGINALLVADAESGYTLVVMSNYDPPSAETAGKKIRAWLAAVKH